MKSIYDKAVDISQLDHTEKTIKLEGYHSYCDKLGKMFVDDFVIMFNIGTNNRYSFLEWRVQPETYKHPNNEVYYVYIKTVNLKKTNYFIQARVTDKHYNDCPDVSMMFFSLMIKIREDFSKRIIEKIPEIESMARIIDWNSITE